MAKGITGGSLHGTTEPRLELLRKVYLNPKAKIEYNAAYQSLEVMDAFVFFF